MSGIYEQNIETLSNQMFYGKEKRKFLDTIEVENTTMLQNSKCGLEFFENGQYYKVCSSYPEEEAKFMTRKMEESKDYLIITFSIANLTLLREIMGKVTEDSRILIYEPNPYLLKYTLMNFDISFLFKSEQVMLLFEFGDEKKFEREIKRYGALGWHNLVKNVHVISAPNTWHYKDKCYFVTKFFLNMLNTEIKVLGNSLEDIFFGQENSYKNIDVILENSDLREIKDKFKGYPAIVVASGPSLDKNIDILQKAQNKALIMSCDASWLACKKHNVKPDAIASIERIENTYKFYYEGKSFDEDVVLVGPDVLWPKIFEEYPGRKIVTYKVNGGIEKWWADNFENLYQLGQGMSCANVAFAYAKYAGCNPIILIGQDLAYTNNKIHSDLTHTKYEGANDKSSAQGLMVEDIYGNMIPTSDVYNLFRGWFELQITADESLKVIDATEGGARIRGSELMTLQEAIDTYCNKELPMHLTDCLSEQVKLEAKDYIKKYEQVIREAKKQKKRLKRIQSKAAKHYRTLEKIYYNKELKEMSENELVQEILKMQKGDEIIQDILSNEYVITYFQQMIRQTIIFVKGLGNEVSADNIRENIRLQANLMGVIKNGVGVINKEYDKMISFLEEKKKKREAELK